MLRYTQTHTQTQKKNLPGGFLIPRMRSRRPMFQKAMFSPRSGSDPEAAFRIQMSRSKTDTAKLRNIFYVGAKHQKTEKSSGNVSLHSLDECFVIPLTLGFGECLDGERQSCSFLKIKKILNIV